MKEHTCVQIYSMNQYAKKKSVLGAKIKTSQSEE